MKLPLCLLVVALWSRAAAADVSPAQPVIPEHSFNLKDFGGTGDGKTLNTDAFHRAVAAANTAGGGTIDVSPGTYLTGPIDLCSSLNLHIEAGATVQFISGFADYIDADHKGRYRPMLQVKDAHDVLISGQGTINGHGEAWWPEARRFKADARAHHAASDTSPRPTMVYIVNSQRVHVEGITLTNSAVFNLVANGTSDLTVDGITIWNPADSPNTDGIDPKDCQRVLIRDCRVDTGDDCVALGGSGGHHEEDVLITDCLFLHGHGCSIGSGTQSGVSRVTVSRCTFDGTVAGVRLKSSRGRGGLVEDVVYEDLTMKNVGTAITISSNYNSGSSERAAAELQSEPLTATTPIWRNITVRNVTVTDAKTAGLIAGLPESPATEILIENVTIAAQTGLKIAYADGVALRDLTITLPPKGVEVTSDATVKNLLRTP